MGKDSRPRQSYLAPEINNLAAIYELGTESQKAEPLFVRAIRLDEKSFGPESPEVGTDLNNLGLLYLLSRRYDDSQKVYQRALAIRIKAFGESDPAVAETMSGYASALHGLHRGTEARQMEDRVHAPSTNQGGKTPK